MPPTISDAPGRPRRPLRAPQRRRRARCAALGASCRTLARCDRGTPSRARSPRRSGAPTPPSADSRSRHRSAELELRIAPEPGRALRIPRGGLRERAVERGGRALLLRPRDQPIPAAHQALVREVDDRRRRERHRRPAASGTTGPAGGRSRRPAITSASGASAIAASSAIERRAPDAARIGERVGQRLEHALGDHCAALPASQSR